MPGVAFKKEVEARIAKIDEELAKMEARKKEIESSLQDPVIYADSAVAAGLHKDLDELEKEISKKTTAWERAAAELESLGQ
jgi:ATP-binding cassette subfamily F protein 3